MRQNAEWDAQVQAEAQLERLGSMSPDEQREARQSTLQLILKKQLTSDQWTQLQRLARQGEIMAMALARTLMAATADAELKEAVNQLKRGLNPLLPLDR